MTTFLTGSMVTITLPGRSYVFELSVDRMMSILFVVYVNDFGVSSGRRGW